MPQWLLLFSDAQRVGDRLHPQEMAGYLLLCTSLDQKYILFVFVLVHVFVFFLCICIYICFRLQPQEMAGGLLLLCTSLDQMYISFVFYFLMYLYLFKCICIRSHPEKMLVSAPMHITEPEELLDGLASLGLGKRLGFLLLR